MISKRLLIDARLDVAYIKTEVRSFGIPPTHQTVQEETLRHLLRPLLTSSKFSIHRSAPMVEMMNSDLHFRNDTFYPKRNGICGSERKTKFQSTPTFRGHGSKKFVLLEASSNRRICWATNECDLFAARSQKFSFTLTSVGRKTVPNFLYVVIDNCMGYDTTWDVGIA